MPSNETPASPGFPSVQDVLTGAAQSALRDGVHEMARADGRRGMVYLQIELCLGDGGEPLWFTKTVHFVPKMHHKDAREPLSGKT